MDDEDAAIAHCPECHTEFSLDRELTKFPLNQALLSLATRHSQEQHRKTSTNLLRHKTPMKNNMQRANLEDD